MRLRIKINCSDSEKDTLINKLKDSYETPALIKAHSIKGGIIFDPVVSEVGQNAFIEYQLPTNFKSDYSKYTLLMDVSEHGGFDTNKNEKYSNIVSGLSGKALKPYFIPKKHVENPCGQHAFFSVPEACITITGHDEDIITITENRISDITESNTVRINKTLLFNGHVDSLENDLGRFKQAALVALDKANCPNCTHMHYYIDASVFRNISKNTSNLKYGT